MMMMRRRRSTMISSFRGKEGDDDKEEEEEHDDKLLQRGKEDEEEEEEEHDDKLLQRLANDNIGLLHPHNKPYEPVAGWPVLHLDDIVLNTLAPQLDPKIWDTLRSQLEKTEIKRMHDRTTYQDILRDSTAIHEYPTSGYGKIKTHIAESESRWERVRRDEVQFLRTLKDLLEKLLQLKVRHLKSHTPINISLLGGTDRDNRPLTTTSGGSTFGGGSPTSPAGMLTSPVPTIATAASSPGPGNWILKPHGRSVQYPGAPPVQHCFRDQIMAERPPHWPVKAGVGGQGSRGGSQHLRAQGRTSQSTSVVKPPDRASLAVREKKYTLSYSRRPSALTSDSHSAGSDQVGGKEDAPGVWNSLRHTSAMDREMIDKFRKIWPPVWMSLAAMEQGTYIVDPVDPSKEYNHCLGVGTASDRRRKTLSDILDTRRVWARMRRTVSRTVDENLWREDREKLESYKVEFGTLWHLPLSKPYDYHQRQMEDLLRFTRIERQKRVVFDCEVSDWYKRLVEQVQEKVPKKDAEINWLLEAIKFHFHMSPSTPKMGKAKLALIVMSLPAFVICQVHVQRAVAFVLTQIMDAPLPLLTGWLAARGLLLVLVEPKSENETEDEGDTAPVPPEKSLKIKA
ncbi:hypothetical protein ACOMHN_032286 [Nucella lapillus]